MNLLIPGDCAPDDRHLLGISGGRDSVALLHALLEAGYRQLILCHLDHQLRGEASNRDARFVHDLAGEHGLELEIGQIDVAAAAAREKISIEFAARRARFAFFQECSQRHGTDRLFLAHHAGDQVETILIHLLRGTGLRGLSGMRPVARVAGLRVIRPFLETPREEIPLPPRFHDDESNSDDAFLRNRLRRHAIPMLRDLLRRDFEPGLRRMATVLREEDQYLRTLTAMAMTSIVDDEKSLRLSPLRALPLALQRRVIRRWLREANISSPGFREVETVRALYRDPSSAAKANLPGGWHVRRRAGKIFLEPPPG